MHKKIKALFCCINFDCTTNFVKKYSAFLSIFSFEYKKEKKNTHWTWSYFKIYFNVYLIVVIYFMNFMNFDFIFKIFLLQHKKIYTLKLIVALNFSLLHHDICFQSFFTSFIKVDLHSMNMNHMTDINGKWLFSISI